MNDETGPGGYNDILRHDFFCLRTIPHTHGRGVD
jgi:hypothetical protein